MMKDDISVSLQSPAECGHLDRVADRQSVHRHSSGCPQSPYFSRSPERLHKLGVLIYGLVMLVLVGSSISCSGLDGEDDENHESSVEDEQDVMDILWMISNSDTMCGSQQMLRDGADAFADGLADSDIDFHVGVTTSHMEEESTEEPVAEAGRLQATPQPVPGDAPSCVFAPYELDHPDVQEDPDGWPRPGDPNPARLDPVVAQIDAAIECTDEPEDFAHLRDFDEDQLRCALPTDNECDEGRHDADDDHCLCPEGDDHGFGNCLDCDSLEQTPPLEAFYPEPEAYRDLDVVLRAADYRDESGEIDSEQLRTDFRCMSMVGTRGDGINRGLEAIGKAVSPEMSGGSFAEFDEALEVRDIHPNSGFVRDDDDGGRTAILFASASNDCSHGGELEETVCGVAECLIQESRGSRGALISTEELGDRFVENLASSRGSEDLDEIRQTIFPAGFLGSYQGLDGIEEALGEEIPDECPSTPPEWVSDGALAVPESCRTDNAVAWSGHRYTHFMEEFSWYYPQPETPGESAGGGEMCNGFEDIMNEMFGPDIY